MVEGEVGSGHLFCCLEVRREMLAKGLDGRVGGGGGYEGGYLRLVDHPTAEPRVMGRRMEAGKEEKMDSGRVSWGM